MWNNNDSLPNPRLGHGIAGFIHQPQPRQAQPVFRFSSRSEELADPSLSLPTPTSSPAPRLKDLGSRLNIEQLARCDAELGNSDALSRALDALPRRESSCNMVTLNREQEGEYVISARSFEYDEVRSAYKYAKDLCDGRIPVQPELPGATNPVRVPNVHAYLTPPSSPETRPERRCSNIEEVADLSLDGESTLVDVPASQGEPDKERELNDNKKPADLNSNESGVIDWYDDDAGEYFEYDSDDDNESVTEFSSEIEEPRPVTLLPPPEYNDLRGFTASPLNLPDLTPALALSSFPEWPVARGGFGEVWKGDIIDKSKTGRQAVAVKRLTIYTDKGEEGARKVLKRTAREIHIWSCLRHRNVLPLLGFCTFRGGIGLVSPWQEAGHVTSWVNKNPSADRLELCEGICAGLAYLHERNVIHGDLRGANVLISLDGTPRLIDFGLATVVDSIRAFSDSSTIAGAVRWMAPELQVTESCGITRASDMFALAMEVYTGAPPFSGIKNDLAVLLKYQQGKRPLRPAVADHNHPHDRNSTSKEILNVCAPMSDSMWDLVQRCWDQSPSSRPTAKSVLREIRRQRKRPR